MSLQSWGPRVFFAVYCQSQTDTLNYNRRFLDSHFSNLQEIWPLCWANRVVRSCLFWSKSVAPGSRDVLRSLRLMNSRLRPSHTFRPTVFWPRQSQDFRLQFLKAQCPGYRRSAVGPKSVGQIIFKLQFKLKPLKICNCLFEGFLK